MEVIGVTGGYDPAYVANVASETLGKDGFLQLLVTQLRHQDPFSPMNSTEFVAQLAQFSSLEQMQNLNAKFDNQSALIQSLNNSMAASLVGREVVISSGVLNLGGEHNARFGLILSSQAHSVTVEILNEGGSVVRQIEMGRLSGGRHEVAWDAADDQGKALPAGVYGIRIEARDMNGEALDSYPAVIGTVESIVYENGAALLTVGGIQVPIATLLEVLGDVRVPSASAADSAGGETGDSKPALPDTELVEDV